MKTLGFFVADRESYFHSICKQIGCENVLVDGPLHEVAISHTTVIGHMATILSAPERPIKTEEEGSQPKPNDELGKGS